MSRFRSRLLMTLLDQPGAAILSALVLLVGSILTEQRQSDAIEMIVVHTSMRVLNQILRKPHAALAARAIAVRWRRVLENEALITVGFLAMAYVLMWQIARPVVAALVIINIAAQLLLMMAARWLLFRANRRRDGRGIAGEKQVLILGTGVRAKAVADMILDSPEFDSRLLGFVDPHRKGQWRYRDIPLLVSIEELPPDGFQVGRGSEFVMANEKPNGELSTISVRPWPAAGGETDLQPSMALESIFSNRQIDTLVVAVEPEDSKVARAAVAIAEQMGVTVCLIPELLASRKTRIRTGFIHGLPTLTFRAVPDCRTRLFVKQAVDLVGAIVALILAAPLMLVTAVAIKLASPGPIMFRQTRCGLNGRLFRMYKFRTMVNGAEKRRQSLADLNEMSGPVFKIKNDPRVTRVGRFLRKTSIDELPQLINILCGEMSLVGPRPPLPSEVARYQPWQHRRLSVKPGITCLWQVNGRNRIDFEKWMKLDLEYIDHWSLWQDVKILARTVPAVLRTNGAS